MSSIGLWREIRSGGESGVKKRRGSILLIQSRFILLHGQGRNDTWNRMTLKSMLYDRSLCVLYAETQVEDVLEIVRVDIVKWKLTGTGLLGSYQVGGQGSEAV